MKTQEVEKLLSEFKDLRQKVGLFNHTQTVLFFQAIVEIAIDYLETTYKKETKDKA